MGGLCKEGHQLLRILNKKNEQKTQHLIDVLSTQHARWVAKRIRRSLFGQELFSSAKTADSQVEQQLASQVSTKKGPMRRLTRAFSNQEVDSPTGPDESDGESQNSCSQPSTPASSDDLSLQSPSEGPLSPHDMEFEDIDSPFVFEADEWDRQSFD